VDPLPGGGTIDAAPAADATYDAIHAFVRDGAAPAAVAPVAIAAYRTGAVLLLSYPKGGA
jgi:hypothetical protein